MIVSEEWHQILSDYNQFSLKKSYEVNKRTDFSSEKMRNLGNCINDYAHSLFGEDF